MKNTKTVKPVKGNLSIIPAVAEMVAASDFLENEINNLYADLKEASGAAGWGVETTIRGLKTAQSLLVDSIHQEMR